MEPSLEAVVVIALESGVHRDNRLRLLLLLGRVDLVLVLTWELEMRWRVTRRGGGGGGAFFSLASVKLKMQDRRCFTLPLNRKFD